MGLVEEVADVPFRLVRQTRLRRFERNLTELATVLLDVCSIPTTKIRSRSKGTTVTVSLARMGLCEIPCI